MYNKYRIDSAIPKEEAREIMDNTFSVQFKTNRKKKGLSQGQVAEMLCVSTQAVSKWETGTSYPDLSLLPTIANLFGVSIDCMLGINISEKEEKINSILTKCKEMTENKQYSDAVTILRNALIQYPSEPRLMYQLAWNLTGTIREHRENLYEAIKAYEKILQITDDPELYYRVLRDLMYRYASANDEETAKRIADKLLPFEFCKEYNLGRSNLLCGRELAEYLLKNIMKYGNAMRECLEYFLDTRILAEEQMSPLSPETAKAKLQQLAQIMELTGKSS